MNAPPDKRKPVPRTIGTGSAYDSLAAIDKGNYGDVGVDIQGKYSCELYPLNLPLATSQPLGGICHSVRVHHPGGATEHRGLFSSAEHAALAAAELNRLFQIERRAA